ncbi:MAG: macro domain-containing protein [Cyanobacteria bacterium P01_A01_bin.45]
MVNSETPIVSSIHRLFITQGNLIFQPVDAIVNPTNSILNHIGLCSDIHRLAGEDLRKYTREIKWLDVNQSCITPGFALKASHVIHTCAPIWDKEHTQTSWEQLRNCYLNCLQTAADHQIHTLAFPCIGTRLRGFPKDLAANIALKEILLFAKHHSFPWQVNIVCHQLEDYEEYQSQLTHPQICELIENLHSQNHNIHNIPYLPESGHQQEHKESRQIAQELSKKIPNGFKLALIGNTFFEETDADNKSIYQVMGQSLAKIDNLILLTSGDRGICEVISRSFWENSKSSGNRVFHIQSCDRQPLDYGTNLYAGQTLKEQQEITAQIGSVYLLVDVDSEQKQEVENALSTGATVIPVNITKVYRDSCDESYGTLLYQNMHCPYYIPKQLWTLLGNPEATLEEIADATAQIIAKTFLPPKNVIFNPDKDEVTDEELKSAVGVDYRKLMVFLKTHQWEAADRETFRLLCEIVSRVEAEKRIEEIDQLLQTVNSRADIQQYQQLEQQKTDSRKYLKEIVQQEFPISSFYNVSSGCLSWSFIYQIPLSDLKTIDLLWITYSKGRFGFSTQEKILQTVWAEFGFIPSLDPENDVFAASENKLRDCLGKSYHLSDLETQTNFYRQNKSNFNLDNLPGILPWLNWQDNDGNFHGIEFHERFDCLFPALGWRGVFHEILAEHFLERVDNGETNFSNCILSNFDLSNQNLQGLNLRNSLLIGTNLRNTNLSYSDLTGADLRGANLEKANLTHTVLEKTNCQHAIFSNTIFLIDDSITVLELLSRSFIKAGYKVVTARDGKEAWDKLQQGLQCSVIFCDIEMPRMNGLELYRELRKCNRLRDIPFVLLTSRGVSRKRDKLMKDLGIKGYFTKPYVEELLLDAAQKLITGEKLDSLVWNH